jgi:hypothetical protein
MGIKENRKIGVGCLAAKRQHGIHKQLVTTGCSMPNLLSRQQQIPALLPLPAPQGYQLAMVLCLLFLRRTGNNCRIWLKLVGLGDTVAAKDAPD